MIYEHCPYACRQRYFLVLNKKVPKEVSKGKGLNHRLPPVSHLPFEPLQARIYDSAIQGFGAPAQTLYFYGATGKDGSVVK